MRFSIPFKLAGEFIFRSSTSEPDVRPQWQTAGLWLIVWGVLIGAIYAVIFRLAWRLFGEYQGIRWVPVAVVLALHLGLCGHRMLIGFVRVVHRQGANDLSPPVALSPAGGLALVLVAAAEFALLASIPVGTWQNPPSSWGWQAALAQLGPLYPRPVYRPLILMPMWGCWAMALAASIGRVNPQASGRTRQMAHGTSVILLFGQWLLGAVVTMIYCSGTGEYLARGVVTALGVLLAAYTASFILGRLHNGQTEATIATTGLATQISFLALYVASASAIYWY